MPKQLSFDQFKTQNQARIDAITAYEKARAAYGIAMEALEPLQKDINDASDALMALGFKDPRKKERATRSDGTPRATRGPRSFSATALTAGKATISREFKKGTSKANALKTALEQVKTVAAARTPKETVTEAIKLALTAKADETYKK
jgi:hypothetical protein